MTSKKEKEDFNQVKKEILSKKEKVKVESENDEPSWYHYVIVILVFITFLYGFFAFFSYLDSQHATSLKDLNNSNVKDSNKFYYNFDIKGKNISVEFNKPKDYLDSLNYSVQVKPINLMNSEEIYFSFANYSKNDNFNMTLSQYKLGLFLRSIYGLRIDGRHRVSSDKFNCSNSSKSVKVIEFLPYSDKNGVFYNDDGCIQIMSENISNFKIVEDKMLLSFLRE